MIRLSACLLAAVALAPASVLPAQYLQSQALGYPTNQVTISLRMTGAQPSTAFGFSVTPATGLTFVAPTSVTTDVAGHVQANVHVTSTQANLKPTAFSITVTHASLPNGQLQRNYVLKSVGGRLASAWPEFVLSTGVFCNPVTSAATMLEVDRFTDLDGDGVFGDLNVERAASGRDPLDFPSEISSDVNATGTAGCIGGSPQGLFLPGGAGRTVAFLTDNRVVNGPCNFTSLINFLEDIAFTPSFGGAPAIFGTSSSNDNVLICRDADGNGSITANEIKVFFDPVVLVNNENYSPDGIAIDPTGVRRAYWISDKSGATGSPTNVGLFRLTDLDGNDQIGAGEFNAAWTGTTGVVQVETQNIDHTEFECVHVDGQGGVLLNHTALGTIFRWVDANANGIAETGEVSNYLTYSAVAALTKSQDFQQAGFPVITGGTGTTPYFGLNLIESVPNVGFGNRDVVFIASGNNVTNGEGNGFVYRCEDLNLDGDVNDLGEVKIFTDPSMITDPYPMNWCSGMDVGVVDLNGDGFADPNEMFVYVATPTGPPPSCGYAFGDATIWRFNDANGDGDATDPGEGLRVAIHPTGAFVRGLEVLPDSLSGGFQHTFYSRSSLMTVRPAGCATPAGVGIQMDFLREKIEEGTQGTPFGGNSRFGIVTHGNQGGVAAGLVLSGGLLPSPFPFSGCDVWVSFPFFADLIAPTVPDANGDATFPIPVPITVATLFLQPFLLHGSSIYVGETAELRIR